MKTKKRLGQVCVTTAHFPGPVQVQSLLYTCCDYKENGLEAGNLGFCPGVTKLCDSGLAQ